MACLCGDGVYVLEDPRPKTTIELKKHEKSINCKGMAAQRFLCLGPSPEASSSSCPFCYTSQLLDYFSWNWTSETATGNLGSSWKRREHYWEWACVWPRSWKGTHWHTGAAHCKETEKSSNYSLGGVCTTPWVMCNCLGSSFPPMTW